MSAASAGAVKHIAAASAQDQAESVMRLLTDFLVLTHADLMFVGPRSLGVSAGQISGRPYVRYGYDSMCRGL